MSEKFKNISELIENHAQPNFMIGIGYVKEFCNGQSEKISQLEADLAKEKKQNRYLRSSLNRICADVSNGEHVDKDWIKDVLKTEPSLLIIDALSNKAHKLEADLKKAVACIEFYADTRHYGVDKSGLATSIDPCDHEDIFHQEIGITARGGKRARETLEKLKRVNK